MDTQIDTHTQTDRHIDTQTDRHIDRHTDTHDQKHYLPAYAGGNKQDSRLGSIMSATASQCETRHTPYWLTRGFQSFHKSGISYIFTIVIDI